MMGAVELLDRLTALGVTVEVTPAETLRLTPGSKVPADMVPSLREHKTEIAAIVQRQATARDRLLERLRAGQAWLTQTNGLLCEEEHRWDKARQRVAGFLDAWCEMETQPRTLFSYQGCIYGQGAACPPDAVVKCVVCSGGTHG